MEAFTTQSVDGFPAGTPMPPELQFSITDDGQGCFTGNAMDVGQEDPADYGVPNPINECN